MQLLLKEIQQQQTQKHQHILPIAFDSHRKCAEYKQRSNAAFHSWKCILNATNVQKNVGY